MILEQIEEYFNNEHNDIFSEKQKKSLDISFLINLHRSQIFVFEGKAKTPACVAKFYEKINEKEAKIKFENLIFLKSKLNDRLKKTIPDPLLFEDRGGHILFIESMLTGEKIPEMVKRHPNFLFRNMLSDYFDDVIDWLIMFHKETQSCEVKFTHEQRKEYLLAPIAYFTEHTTLSEIETKYFENFIKKTDMIIGKKIPLVCCHGDFWTENIIYDKNRIGVVDWGGMLKNQPPFFDLFMFISSWRFPFNGSGSQSLELKSFKFSFIDKNWFSAMLQKIINRYMLAMDIELRALNIFFPVFLIKKYLQVKAERHPCFSWKSWRELISFYIENETKVYRTLI